MIKFIIAALGLEPEQVCYVAYTGKAAQVLKQKGCPNPFTAHKLLYKAKPMPNGTFKFEPKPTLDEELEVIIVDDGSTDNSKEICEKYVQKDNRITLSVRLL